MTIWERKDQSTELKRFHGETKDFSLWKDKDNKLFVLIEDYENPFEDLDKITEIRDFSSRNAAMNYIRRQLKKDN